MANHAYTAAQVAVALTMAEIAQARPLTDWEREKQAQLTPEAVQALLGMSLVRARQGRKGAGHA